MGRGFARRHGTAACLVAATILGAATGCTSGTTSSAPAASMPATAPAAASIATSGAAVPALPARALASPGCAAATASGPRLGAAGATSITTGGSPFGVAATPDGRWAFDVSGGLGTAAPSVAVLRLGAARGTAPALTRTGSVPLPASPSAAASLPAGAAVTPDGEYLLVADGAGLVVISVARAEAGAAGAVLGTLSVPGPAGRPGLADGAIEVAVSPDSRFAFVTLENDAEAAVFNLDTAVAHGLGHAGYVGAVPLGGGPVGITVSPDGRWLYATSEDGLAAQHPAGPGSPGGCQGGVPGTGPGERPGTLTVVSLRRAESDPARSVTATVDAGYQPVRVVTAADGTQVWVTARASDDVLCFSAARLAADPARALVAIARVGSEPVGLAAVRGGTLLVVADSNRFAAAGENSGLSVVSVPAALAGRPAVAGDLTTGSFPRDMAVSPDGTLLVSDYASGQVQAVNTAALAAAG